MAVASSFVHLPEMPASPVKVYSPFTVVAYEQMSIDFKIHISYKIIIW